MPGTQGETNMNSIIFGCLLTAYTIPVIAQDWENRFSAKDHSNAAIFSMLDSIQTSVKQSINSVVPDLRYCDVFTGREDSLTSLRGKVVLLSVWSIGCAPCQREMPALRRVQSELRKKGFALLAISMDDSARQRRFFKSNNISLGGITALVRLHHCPYPFTMYFNPSAYLIDRKGILRQFWAGPKTYEDLRKAISLYL